MDTRNADYKDLCFRKLFTEITLGNAFEKQNLFSLLEKDFYVVTAGKSGNYNSMVGSGGGVGLFLKKPSTWNLFRTDRYTLELIKREQTYTLSYFPSKYKKQVLFLASKSGRDSTKMKEFELTSIHTPSENIAFKEANLIIECQLTAITTPLPNDFYSKESKSYIDEAYKDANEYRKLVFGEIIHLWHRR